MKLLVSGSRDIKDRAFVFETLDDMFDEPREAVDVLYHGDAIGVDEDADQWARNHNIDVCPQPVPDWAWDKFGKQCGPKRNEWMVEQVDRVVAIWDGESRGTKSTVRYTESLGKPLTKVIVDIDVRGRVKRVVKRTESNGDQRGLGEFE